MTARTAPAQPTKAQIDGPARQHLHRPHRPHSPIPPVPAPHPPSSHIILPAGVLARGPGTAGRITASSARRLVRARHRPEAKAAHAIAGSWTAASPAHDGSPPGWSTSRRSRRRLRLELRPDALVRCAWPTTHTSLLVSLRHTTPTAPRSPARRRVGRHVDHHSAAGAAPVEFSNRSSASPASFEEEYDIRPNSWCRSSTRTTSPPESSCFRGPELRSPAPKWSTTRTRRAYLVAAPSRARRRRAEPCSVASRPARHDHVHAPRSSRFRTFGDSLTLLVLRCRQTDAGRSRSAHA